MAATASTSFYLSAECNQWLIDQEGVSIDWTDDTWEGIFLYWCEAKRDDGDPASYDSYVLYLRLGEFYAAGQPVEEGLNIVAELTNYGYMPDDTLTEYAFKYGVREGDKPEAEDEGAFDGLWAAVSAQVDLDKTHVFPEDMEAYWVGLFQAHDQQQELSHLTDQHLVSGIGAEHIGHYDGNVVEAGQVVDGDGLLVVARHGEYAEEFDKVGAARAGKGFPDGRPGGDPDSTAFTTYLLDDDELVASVELDGQHELVVDANGEPVSGTFGWVIHPETQELLLFDGGPVLLTWTDDNGQEQQSWIDPSEVAERDGFNSGVQVLSYWVGYCGWKVEAVHHSSPVLGMPVAGAGDMTVEQGRIVKINDQSGHYQPDGNVTHQAVSLMHDAGLLGQTEQETFQRPDGTTVTGDAYHDGRVTLTGKQEGEQDVNLLAEQYLQTEGNEAQIRAKQALTDQIKQAVPEAEAHEPAAAPDLDQLWEQIDWDAVRDTNEANLKNLGDGESIRVQVGSWLVLIGDGFGEAPARAMALLQASGDYADGTIQIRKGGRTNPGKVTIRGFRNPTKQDYIRSTITSFSKKKVEFV